MARRKREDPDGGSRRGGNNPGSYVQVSGERPRKPSAGHARFRDDAEAASVERVGPGAAKYQPEREQRGDEREEKSVERVFAPPRRAHGPLGMETESRDPPSSRDSIKKTSLGIGPQLTAERAREIDARSYTPAPEPSRAPSEQRVRVLEISAVSADSDSTHHRQVLRPRSDPPVDARASEPSPPAAQVLPDPSVVADAAKAAAHPSSALALPSAVRPASMPPAGSVRPPAREEFASVLDARPSIRPSEDPVPVRQGPSWGMVFGVAALSSIIAAAGVVALQEMFGRGRHEPQAAVIEPAPKSSVTKGAATGAQEQAAATPTVAAPAPVAAAPTPEAPAMPVPAGAAVGAEAEAPSEPDSPAGVGELAPVAAAPALPGPSATAEPAATASPTARSEEAPAAAPAPASKALEPDRPASRRERPRNRVLAGGLVEPTSKVEPREEPGANEPLPSNPYAD